MSDFNKLPADWNFIPLNDAVEVILGQSPKSSTYNENHEGLPFFQGKTEFGAIYPTIRKWCTEPKKTAEKDDVLVSVRAPVGPTNLAPSKCAIGRGLAALRPLKGENSKYFLYLIRRYQQDLAALGTGTTFEAISGATLKNFMVPVPPREQQKQIVAKIEQLFSHIDAGIEALNTAKQRLKQYRQSVLKAAVTGELTKEWREANKEKLEPSSKVLLKIEEVRNNWIEEQIQKGNKEASRLRNKLKKHQFDELDSSIIPNEWVSVSLTKLCLLVVDCHNKTAPYVEEGIPLIRTSNIKEGAINFHKKMKYVTQETYDFWSRRCPPNAGDIFLTREAPMGESAIVPKTPKVCMGQRMMLLRVIHELTDVEYLHFAIMEPLFQERIHQFKVGMGVQHLRVGDVEKLVIAMPSLEEQKVIVRKTNDKLELIIRLEKEIDIQLLKATKNKQSILVSAFSGRLVNE